MNRCWVLPLLVLLPLVACDDAAPSSQPGTLRTIQMTIGSKSYTLEVAETEETREHGLMQRDVMPADHGMIFVFDDETDRNFWMKNTRFPLDILYVNSAAKVVSIKHMKPYDLSNVPSDGPAKYAIELNVGDADKDGVHAGDTVNIPQTIVPTIATTQPR